MTPLLLSFIERCGAEQADPDLVHRMLRLNQPLANEYLQKIREMDQNSVSCIGGNVFKLPFLSQEDCDALLLAAENYDFSSNPEEELPYQINEAILSQVDPEVFQYYYDKLFPLINAYSLFVYSTPITSIDTMQLAKYSPEGTPGTGWHHDKTSDVSVVISLNPGEFEGGGTELRLTPSQIKGLGPLPQGHGLFFNGKCVQHRGLPVTKGERMLLVIWCKTGEA